jgi:hypothetical protein
MADGRDNSSEWLEVPDLVRDLGHAVSDDQIRNWCRTGKLPAFNKGNGKRAYWIVKREEWERFKHERQAPKPEPRTRAQIYRERSGVNLLGV